LNADDKCQHHDRLGLVMATEIDDYSIY